jgi:hypothetical protein
VNLSLDPSASRSAPYARLVPICGETQALIRIESMLSSIHCNFMSRTDVLTVQTILTGVFLRLIRLVHEACLPGSLHERFEIDRMTERLPPITSRIRLKSSIHCLANVCVRKATSSVNGTCSSGTICPKSCAICRWAKIPICQCVSGSVLRTREFDEFLARAEK